MDILLQDERVLWHPFTPNPHLGPKTVFESAKGAYVYEVGGRPLLDATSSWWCTIHGHCHPRLVSALCRQADRLDQILFAPHTHPLAVELATALLQKLGSPFSKIFYSDNGSTAVETALKICLQYWQLLGENRKEFVSIGGAYHGDTLGAVSVSHSSQFHSFFKDRSGGSFQSTMPHCYRCPLDKQFPSCELACLESIESVFRDREKEIAGLIVEPLILGAAGMIKYPVEYLKKLVGLAKERNIPVIFDEVFTGFGRTGKFFAKEYLETEPDLICLSKGLTSGMLPLGVTAVSSKIHEPFIGDGKLFAHGHTFTGNALSVSVALESLKLFDELQLIQRNEKLIAIFQGATPDFLELPNVGQVRHLGMIWAIELVLDKKTKEYPKPLNGPGWKIASQLWDRGIWIRPLDNMIYIIPPYCITVNELEHLLKEIYIEVSNATHFR